MANLPHRREVKTRAAEPAPTLGSHANVGDQSDEDVTHLMEK